MDEVHGGFYEALVQSDPSGRAAGVLFFARICREELGRARMS